MKTLKQPTKELKLDYVNAEITEKNFPMDSQKYDNKYFRLVKHGVQDINAYCRHCNWSDHNLSAVNMARKHAKENLHTVDIYRENHTEYTSYIPKNNIIHDRTVKLLKYECPSTGRVYTKFVPFEFEKADEAQAWSFQIELKEYYALKAQS